MWSKPLVRNRRRTARLALYLGPMAFFALVWAIIGLLNLWAKAADMQWGEVDYSELEAVQLLQQFLRFDTTHPDGNEIPAAEFIARQLEAAGIPAHVERVGERNANVWGILEGEDPRALVLHSHLDSDPVYQPKSWRHPPFSGVIEPPFIYGRGAFDMKSYTIAQLMSVLELTRRGETPRRSVILLATGEEEVDSRLGTQWVLRHHPELVERFDAVLTEGGAVEAVTVEHVKYWGTEIGQKRFVDVEICDVNRGRLEALHHAINAIELDLEPPSPEVTRFLDAYAASREHPAIRRMVSNPATMLDDPRIDFLPKHLKALLRNEVYAFPVVRDVEGGGYKMQVILHLKPDAELDEAWAELFPDGLFGFSVAVDVPHGYSGYSSTEHEVYRGLDEYMAEVMPEVDHGPLLVPFSATDSRFFRAAGIPSYGFSPFWILSADVNKMKGRNERIPLPAFADGVELYVGLVEHLVNRPASR